ncbi:uncharacterized protein [Gossypium hirsutum]|uniref:Retrotransposon gag protein n=1 Tax=Gossypium hirsutum TaxID=3635 RepID=A0ABM3AM36_GOSHI|nr:uncharacterized protein LOC107907995 [Gossypium hirsutum]
MDEGQSSMMEAQLTNLTAMVSKLMTRGNAKASLCGICCLEGHTTDMCPTLQEGEANAVFPNQRRYDPYSATYNEGWRDHPNLRYQNRATPPGFDQKNSRQYNSSQQQPNHQNLSAETKTHTMLEQMMNMMVDQKKETKGRFQSLESAVKQLQTRASSTDPVANLRDNVSAITLRSGKELRSILKKFQKSDEENDTEVKKVRLSNIEEENLALPKVDLQPSQTAPKEVGKSRLQQSTTLHDAANSDQEMRVSKLRAQASQNANNQPRSYVPKAPFPQRLRKEKSDDVNAEILETFRKVQVNIPFINAFKQVPRYAKFLKELCTSKRKLIGNEKISLGENVSAVFQKKLPIKCKDPGMFSIPCKIGELKLDRAMLDLGASINVMPRSIYDKVQLGALKDTGLIIQLANRSNAYPDGVLEDVLVQVNELVFPADFYVLDMGASDNSVDVPLLLGRPFLKTARTKIDVHKGNLTMEFDGEIIKFNIFDAMRYPTDINSVFTLDVIDNFVQDVYELGEEDELKSVLAKSIFYIDKQEFMIFYSLIDSVCALDSPKLTRFKPILPNLTVTGKQVPSLISPPKLELKELPENLKYIYLGENQALPLIVVNALTESQESKLLRVLREHKEAFGWTLADIKGLSTTLCTHKIALEPDSVPKRDPQR